MAEEKPPQAGKSKKVPIPSAADIQPPPPPPAPKPAPAPPKPAPPPRQRTAAPSPSRPVPERIESSQGMSVVMWLTLVGGLLIGGSVLYRMVRDEFSPPQIAQQLPTADGSKITAPSVNELESGSSRKGKPSPVEVATAVPADSQPPPNVLVPTSPLESRQPIEPRVSSPAPAPTIPPADWSAKRGFPYAYGVTLAEWEHIRSGTDENRLRQKQQIVDLEKKIDELVDEVRQNSGLITARAFVIDKTASEVLILADVTAGWLTYEGFVDNKITQSGLVWIKLQGGELQPLIPMRIGVDIQAEQADGLRWGDRMTVEFEIRSVEDRAPIVAEKLRVGKPLVVVEIEGLRCVHSQAQESVSTVWGDPGTIPLALGNLQLAEKVAGIMGVVVKQGTARLRIKEVSKREIVLYRDVATGIASVPTILVKRSEAAHLTVPVRVVGAERVTQFTDETRILVSFKVLKFEPGWWRANDLSYDSVNKYALGVFIDDLTFEGVVNVDQ